jgi:hypothetical protein
LVRQAGFFVYLDSPPHSAGNLIACTSGFLGFRAILISVNSYVFDSKNVAYSAPDHPVGVDKQAPSHSVLA